MENAIKLGISRCLLGENVRYDGGHKLDRYLRDVLGPHVVFVPVCPEVECGLPVPREALRLVGDPQTPRLVGARSGEDHTERMRAWAGPRVEALADEGLCGFIFRYGSPSSGMSRVKVYPEGGGAPSRKGRGLFAGLLMDRLPLLPVEDDGRLRDPELRENFVERVFVAQRWNALMAAGPDARSLVDFHSRHKLLVMAHSVQAYRELGRLVAGAGVGDPQALARDYRERLNAALLRKAGPRQHRNVLEHCQGYFKKLLTSKEKQELAELIRQYGDGLLPRIVPMTLLNHYVRKYGQDYLADQVYLNPPPAELRLLNHA